ncbi:Smi1p Ecym_2079 [Eremothecium cymbalariae DBVPG|uniref:Knr4/Smi1-like domain-containing protein n=1 Tax=Eremothecium cymbalariae (strain CBS 270.75 / DBVPG 7215 / KCTC 17166 / NRRL Y-17582) TaxID=931890 RepID=G8JPI6_ERECY|nr:Hypothetical protein Ecym_2079 [Eremothecium cymbalariae DBVPG\
MEGLKRTWRQIVYTFSTEDRYAGFNPNEGTQGGGLSAGTDGFDSVNGSQIQLNELVDGGEVGGNDGVSESLLAWRHIDSWCSEHNPDLYATLSSPCTKNDISRAERDLAITFPAAVRASLRIHDGQEDIESMQGASGLIYGLKLMSLDEIAHMTQTWRNVAAKLQREAVKMEQRRMEESSTNLLKPGLTPQAVKQKGYGKVENQDYNNNPHLHKDISQNYNKQFKMDKIPKQGSIPPLAVQPVYAHPGWIPMVTDQAGNHIGVDLAPGPKGKYAQVILFGRDFDTKFVVADNWGDFLLNFVNDLEKGNWVFVDNTDDYLNGEGDLMFIDKSTRGPILEYMGVLKKRVWDNWQKTKPMVSAPGSASNASNPALTASVVSTTDLASRSDTNGGIFASNPSVDASMSPESVSYNQVPEVIVEESNLRINGSSDILKDMKDERKSPTATEESVVDTKSAEKNEAKSSTNTVEEGENQKDSLIEINHKEAKDAEQDLKPAEDFAVEKLQDEFENVAL